MSASHIHILLFYKNMPSLQRVKPSLGFYQMTMVTFDTFFFKCLSGMRMFIFICIFSDSSLQASKRILEDDMIDQPMVTHKTHSNSDLCHFLSTLPREIIFNHILQEWSSSVRYIYFCHYIALSLAVHSIR